jgi:hypothetical protein
MGHNSNAGRNKVGFFTRLLSTLKDIPSPDVQSNGYRSQNSMHLKKVRELMSSQNIDALIVPTDDPHLSEYTAPYYNRREFISGFTGSAGTVLITGNSCTNFD